DPAPPPAPSTAVPATSTEGDDTGGGGRDGGEVFESAMDADFQRFADRLAQNPEQVIRYEFGGAPPPYSRSDHVGRALAGRDGKAQAGRGSGLPRCGNCGAPRVFEVQMTPHAITELEGDAIDLDGMDWGTVIVGVCERDCQESGVGPG